MSDINFLSEKYKFWKFFREISEIPRGSGNCERISGYIAEFAGTRDLRYRKDESGNVIIFKPASPDCKTDKKVMLQGHLDMVTVKTDDCKKDFLNEGIDLTVEEGYVKAKGTSLGADNGIGVAYILEVLDDETLTHPGIEAVFTTDEETGMLGADALDTGDLESSFLLNIDSEEEGVFTAGCAGNTFCLINFKPECEKTKANSYKISFNDLTGGHSGVEIGKHRGNAYRLLGRLISQMWEVLKDISFVSIDGGGKDNAIAVSCEAVVCTDASEEDFKKAFVSESEKIKEAYALSDPHMRIEYAATDPGNEPLCFTQKDNEKMMSLLTEIPDGVVRMFGENAELVETSLNLGIVEADKDGVKMHICLRSNVEVQREYLKKLLEKQITRLGAQVTFGPETQIWSFRKESVLRDTITDVYARVSGSKATVNVMHAGVECGFFTNKMPGLDAVSFGPEIRDIHTYHERLNIRSAEMYREIIIKTLERLCT